VDNNFGRNSRLVTSRVAKREQGFIPAPTHTPESVNAMATRF
jgi:hypothetical protein